MMDSDMLFELALLTACLFVAILVWAWVDSRQEKKMIQSCEIEASKHLRKGHSAH